MRLMDAQIQIPFVNGASIYRASEPKIVYYVDCGLICKSVNDGKPHAKLVAAPYTVEDWQADDWEVVE